MATPPAETRDEAQAPAGADPFERRAEEPFDPNEYPPLDLDSPQLTIRALVSGCLIGGVLSLCNIYAGLKIGWGFNMSITAMLIAFGVFRAFGRPMGLLENNINQTTASSAASISSAGLVAPIPAFTILTSEELSYPVLVLWTAAVSLVGVVVAIGLRRQMIEVDKLPFPGGVASAETIKQIYAQGKEAMARVMMLVSGAVVGAVVKLTAHFAKLHALALPGSITAKAGAASGVSKYTFANLGFSLDPSVLMIGVGAIIGLRAGVSLILGAGLSWLWLAPWALDEGWAQPGPLNEEAMWFGAVNKWMLWPGVAMMVTASLTSFAFSWKSIVTAIRGGKSTSDASDPYRSGDLADDPRVRQDVPRNVFLIGLVVALVAASVTQTTFFGIPLWIAVAGVLFTFVLAVVAGRVSGETGITPVGPMGKVTQLLFGVVSPGDVAGNLMAANVTGGAASQCADLLHDLKTGALIGASPRQQAFGQFFGVMAGALIGCWGYLLLCPDPAGMLLTDEWPAPAVAAWKAVAELFREGLAAMPAMAPEAMAIAGGLGVVLAVAEKVVPKKALMWVPSPGSIGLAMVVPALYSISMFLGAIAAFGVTKVQPAWAKRFLIVLAAGLIAGESLVGVGLAIYETIAGVAGGG
ncbi:MAG: OPT/YSL family transporter [Myxococcales bacterium]|nr:OPT/YSL family transporter [Myxococcales bacterium]